VGSGEDHGRRQGAAADARLQRLRIQEVRWQLPALENAA
jgi:hypothetical protein